MFCEIRIPEVAAEQAGLDEYVEVQQYVVQQKYYCTCTLEYSRTREVTLFFVWQKRPFRGGAGSSQACVETCFLFAPAGIVAWVGDGRPKRSPTTTQEFVCCYSITMPVLRNKKGQIRIEQ